MKPHPEPTDQPSRPRVQFSIRTLLLAMLIVGPLSGIMGPRLATRLLDYLSYDAEAAEAARLSRTIKLRQQQQIRLWRAQIRQLQQYSLNKQRNLLIHRPSSIRPRTNSDGTFDMRYHLPQSNLEASPTIEPSPSGIEKRGNSTPLVELQLDDEFI